MHNIISYLDPASLVNYAKSTTLEILRKRPKILNNLLSKYGDNKIIKISICRTPLSKPVYYLVNIITLDEFRKNRKKLNYDNIYHLYMIVYLDNGVIFGIEKNVRLNIWFKITIRKNSKCKNKIVNNITLIDFIENGEKIGGSDFYRYTADYNNCQKFINDLLKSNKIIGLSKFVLQDAGSLVSQEIAEKSHTITDIAGVGHYLYSGGL